MSNSGWYPDPGGQPGHYRYWTGSGWSEELTTNPSQTPPPPTSTGPNRNVVGWWIAAVVALLAVGLVIWLAVRVVSSEDGRMPWEPAANPSQNICTAGVISHSASPEPKVAGRVSGGHLSYPLQGAPWDKPEADNRVPFGTIAMVQSAIDQRNWDGKGTDWVSSLLVSDLVSGDGFANSKSAAEVVLKCVLGTYYSDTPVTSKVISAAKHSVDGHDGWLIETQLSFDVAGLDAKGERVLLLVVQVETDQFGLFYASVPDTSPDRLPEARKAMAKLEVS